MAQRAISPHVGGWALIGGHIENNGETVEEGAIREFLEETSRHTGTNPRLVESRANGHGHLLMVVEHDPIEADYFIRGTPCKENLALGILWDARELCFDIHTDLASKWLRKHA